MKEVHKRKYGKGIQWVSVVLVCAVFLGACGSSDEFETISIESINITGDAPEGTAAPEAPQTEQPEESTAPKESQAPQAPAETVPAECKTADSAQPKASGDEFNGTIMEIGASSFKAGKTYVEDLGEEGLLAVSPADPDPADFMEVKYTDETVFIIRSSSDMGITHSDAQGTSADLEVGRSLVATGSRDGNVFTASEIVIYHFS